MAKKEPATFTLTMGVVPPRRERANGGLYRNAILEFVQRANKKEYSAKFEIPGRKPTSVAVSLRVALSNLHDQGVANHVKVVQRDKDIFLVDELNEPSEEGTKEASE